MPHITFERAAAYYDRTRGFPEGVAERLCEAILAETGAGPGARFLELGVGTGRIALPFVQRGCAYTGIDLAAPMLAQLQGKLAAGSGAARHRLLRGDVTRLPLADASFDVLLAAHVLHLVDGWEQALLEARRVLRRPGGCLLIIPGGRTGGDVASPLRLVNRQWDAILRELGVDSERVRPGLGHGDHGRAAETLAARLAELGAQTAHTTLVEYDEWPRSPRAVAQRHFDRIYSGDWLVPDEVQPEAARRLAAWLDAACPAPDEPVAERFQLDALVARW